MKTTMGKGVRLGLVAGLVVTGLVGVTSLTASGSGTRPTVDYGTVTIGLTDRAGTLTLVRDQAFGGGSFTQALSVSTPCSTLIAGPVLDSNTDPVMPGTNLLNFDAAVAGGFSPNVQLPSDGIGVTDGANCGAPSGLVGPGETLTLELGAFFPDGVRIETGTLQIGKSRGSDRDLRVAYDNGAFGEDISVPVGGAGILVTDADNSFESVSIRSTASQSSRGLSLRTSTVFNLVAPAPVTAPDAPTDVTALRGNAKATVSWTPPEDDGGLPVTYELRYSSDDGDSWTDPTAATSPQDVLGLTNGTTYIFEVRAINEVGPSEYARSNAVTPATAPGAPTNVAGQAGAGQVNVTWDAPEDDGGLPVTYQLRYAETGQEDPPTYTPVPLDPATATSRLVTGLADGTEYVFEVKAVNDAGESAWIPSDPVATFALPVDCGTSVEVNGAEGDIADKVTFLRGENEDKPGENVAGDCLEVDATVMIVSDDETAPEGVTDYVFWDNTFEDINGDIQRVNATVTIDWAPVLAADAAELNRLIDYDGPSGPALYRETLWCESFEQISDNPVTYSAVLPDWYAEGSTDGSIIVIEDGVAVRKAPWCLVSDTRVQQGGQIFQTEILFGSGDPSRTSSFR